MSRRPKFDKLLDDSEAIVAEDGRPDVRLKKICKLLAGTVDYYNWVGFYIAEPGLRELVLGPYVGAPTDHIRIPYGRGICGQAADLEKTFLIQDVSKEANYLSCSILVRSEIVVPVFRHSRVVAEIDVDSHHVAPFQPDDRQFLESLAVVIEPLINA
jgi:L-methionine (R)-S-oxide reductase